MEKFNGLGMNMGNLSRLSDAKTRSISPENFDGEKGKGGMSTDGPSKLCARELGQGWKVSPYIIIRPGKTVTIADIKGPGAIQHIWMTPALNHWRFAIIRVYWDGQKNPSIECPLGDFFCNPMGKYKQISSLAVCTNPWSGLNSYWEMPFRKSCKITVENIDEDRKAIYKNKGNEGRMILYYQIDYTLTEVPGEAAYFHAQFRRTNPLPYKEVYSLLDGVKGKGHYVGTYMLWGLNSSNWWGEGEIKFFLDGDKKFPTICGTGTEDYFCGSYDFADLETNQYVEFTTPYAGVALHKPNGVFQAVQRFSMYRWHIMDPIRFEKDLKVTIQALGWRNDGRYLPLQDDISSVAFWYQTLPSAKLNPLPEKDKLEISFWKNK
ncbi:MAG: glycoside hydrolase family 172 protein [Candidatus Firestonebacteria bacterium]